MYKNGSVQSDDDRVVALLLTFLEVIKDYKTPPNKNLSWDLDKHIRTQVTIVRQLIFPRNFLWTFTGFSSNVCAAEGFIDVFVVTYFRVSVRSY